MTSTLVHFEQQLATCCSRVAVLQTGWCRGVVHLYWLLSLNTLRHEEKQRNEQKFTGNKSLHRPAELLVVGLRQVWLGKTPRVSFEK